MRFTLTIAVALTTGLLAAQDEKQKPTGKPAEKAPAKQSYPKVLMKTSMGDIVFELFPHEAPKTVANFLGLANGTKEFTDPKTREKVKRPYYDGLIFHRVIPKFMAQGGCPLGTGSGDPGYKFEDEINAKALGLDKIKAFENGQPNRVLLIRSQQQFQQVVTGPLVRKLGIKDQKEFEKRKKEFTDALAALTVMDVYKNMGYRYDDSRPSHPMSRGTIAMANAGPNTNGSQFFINMVDNGYLNGKHTVFGRVLSGLDVLDKMQGVKMKAPSKPEKDIVIQSVRTISDKELKERSKPK